ncbi:MAG: protein kinase domain-containing protein [Myxococcales bacterium]|jgi:hypothetical protein
MSAPSRFHVLGPLHATVGSRALLALRVGGTQTIPVVMLPIPSEVLEDPELLLRVRRETERATALEHPSILRVFGLAETERGLARAVEYANGESLRRVLEKARRMPAELAARLVVDVATGVHFAHLAGNEDGLPLVHGDLRPETLMLTFDGVAKVSGYGALWVAPREPDGKRVPGRRKYAAPEQILGGRAAMTPQTDIFLLGLVLWEALTGAIPFQDCEDPDKAVLEVELPLDSPYIPEKLRAVIARATAKRGNARFASALDLKLATEEAFESLPSSEDLAAWLAAQFDGDALVEERRRRIEVALEQIAQPAPDPAPAPQAAATPAPMAAHQPASAPTAAPQALPAPPTPPVAAALGHPSPAPSAPPPGLAAGRQPAPRRAPAYLTAGVGAALILLAVFLGHRTANAPAPAPQVVADATELPALDSTPPPPVVIETPPQQPEPEPPTQPGDQAPAGNAPPPALARNPAPSAPTDEEPALALPSFEDLALPTLDLFAVPNVDVWAGGKRLGHTPLQARLPPGRHTLTLKNKRLAIDVKRDIEVQPKGVTRLDLWVGVGSIGVRAPEGSSVYIDGKLYGTTPLEKRIELYEGSYQLRVDMKGVEWKQAFSLKDGDLLNFDVGIAHTQTERKQAVATE